MNETLGHDAEIKATALDKLIFDISTEDFTIYDPETGIHAKWADTIFIRGPKMRLNSSLAYYISLYAQDKRKKCVNSYGLYYPGTKFSQAIIFRENGAPFLRTLYSANKQILIRAAEQTLGFPYILKTNVGSHGDSNYLVHTNKEAENILEQEPKVDFLAQVFCPNERDYRLLLVGDEHLLFERRGDSGTHLNNTSKGGQAARTDNALQPEVIELARKVAHALRLQIAGVDIMPNIDTEQLYFLEINSQPQLRSGALLAEKRALLQKYFLH